ncbi:MAG: alcohol dehydrogenase family protein [Pseudomonadota bacterium]
MTLPAQEPATLPETMSAFLLTGHGGFDKLVWRTDVPLPRPGPGEVLVKVLACGLNNTDVNTRTGWYSKGVTGATTGDALEGAGDDGSWGGGLKLPRIQGADVAGRIVGLGPGADPALLGKRIMVDVWLRDWDDPMNLEKTGYYGSEIDGGFAEYSVVPVTNAHPIDCDLADAEIATFATSYVTAENMLNRAAVGEGDTVLIPGASGGVGSALIQLAHRRGARTVAMCGADKAEQVAALGPAAVLPRAPEDLGAALEAAIGTSQVTVVADVVGGAMFGPLIEALARGGRYTCAGAIAGPMVELDLRTFYLNNLAFFGATVVPPGVFADLVGYVARGEIKPLLAATYPLADLHAAQKAFIEKRHVGNIAVVP